MSIMNNDAILILKTLYEERMVDTYELHVKTKIPPTTLFCVLEKARIDGDVTRDGLIYHLTAKGEARLATELGQSLIRPSMSFKSVPAVFSGKKVDSFDVSILNDI